VCVCVRCCISLLQMTLTLKWQFSACSFIAAFSRWL
jgi:hypothetical protein